MQTGMGRPWKEGMDLYESRTNPGFNKEFDKTVETVSKVESGEAEPGNFFPGSSVETVMEVGDLSYVDVLFLSEAQIQKHCKASSKALDLQLEERQAEDGSGPIWGVPRGLESEYFSCEDVPEDVSFAEFWGFRKVRLFNKTSTVHQKIHLTPDKQLRQLQGKDLQAYVDSKRKRHPGATVGKQLPTISSKRARAELLDSRKQAKSAAMAEQMMQAGHNAKTEPDEPLEVVDMEKVQRLKQFSVGAVEVEDEQPSMSRKKRRQARNGPASASQTMTKREKADNSMQLLPVDEITAQMKHDAALLKVSLQLGWVPDCFYGLDPDKALNGGAKLGNQTFQ
ncbi:unnamed protein product, partial [Symbiodinium necroappetens]